MRTFDDSLITGLQFTPDGRGVFFFYKKGNQWRQERKGATIPILSLAGSKDAAKFAAIFAGSADIYTCNLGKAIKRLRRVHEVYSLRYEEIKEVVSANPASECPNLYNGFEINLEGLLLNQKVAIQACLLSLENDDLSQCSELQASAAALHEFNSKILASSPCPSLY